MVTETVPKNILDKLNAGITIEGVDLDIRDLSHTQDSIKIGDGTDFLAIDAAGKIGVSSMPTVTVQGTDIDIRDLTSASDSVEIIQDTFADCKVEAHAAAGEVIPTGIHGWDGGAWETLNTDTNNRLLVSAPIKTHNIYSFNEYLADNGTFFAKHSNGSGTTNTIGTVPANKIWYITAATLSYITTSTTSGQYVILQISGDTVAQLFCPDADNLTQAISLSFPIPIKLTATQTAVFNSSGAQAYGEASIIGYEVDA